MASMTILDQAGLARELKVGFDYGHLRALSFLLGLIALCRSHRKSNMPGIATDC